MKLTIKLTFILILAIAVLRTGVGYIMVRNAAEFYESDMKRQADLTGRALADFAEEMWRISDEAHVLETVAKADVKRPLMGIRWIWLDAPPGDPHVPTENNEALESLRRGSEVFVKGRDHAGESRLYLYVPVDVDVARPAALELSQDLTPLDEYVRATTIRTTLFAVLMILLSGVVVLLLGVRFVARPLDRLIAKTRRVGAGDLSGRVYVHGRDELAELAEALNTMCAQLAEAQDRVRAETDARIAAIDQLRHGERLRTVGRLASGVAHELGTPLNIVLGRASQNLRGELAPQEAAEVSRIIVEQSERMTVIIQQLLDFSRQHSPKRSAVDLRAMIRQTLDLLAPMARKSNVAMTFTGGETRQIACVDGGLIQQVLMNLVMNALQAMRSGGTVEIGICREDVRVPEGARRAAGEHLCLYVKDEGEGIPEENLPHLFEPFFTTKGVGEGSGLGLSIAYGIVSDHGGWIDVDSIPAKGSCFYVYLPVEDRLCPDES